MQISTTKLSSAATPDERRDSNRDASLDASLDANLDASPDANLDASPDANLDANLNPALATLVRLTDLLDAARERRRGPENLRASIARRFVFLRAATTRLTEQVQAMSEHVADWATRRDRVREQVTAMSHVLRVRADLTPDEQRSFDQLVIDYTETTLGLLIDRDHDMALSAVQRYLASVATTMPPSP